MSLQTIDWVSAVVTTTNATITTICSATIPVGAAVSCTAEIVGRNTSTGDIVVAGRRLAARMVAGVLTQVGVTSVLGTDAVDTALSAVILAMDVSGTSVRVRATGLLATNIEWFTDIRLRIN